MCTYLIIPFVGLSSQSVCMHLIYGRVSVPIHSYPLWALVGNQSVCISCMKVFIHTLCWPLYSLEECVFLCIHSLYVLQELRDRNDELTMEVEALKQQVASHQRKGRGGKDKESKIPVRHGSVLSDYQKPTVVNRRGSMSTGNSFSPYTMHHQHGILISSLFLLLKSKYHYD